MIFVIALNKTVILEDITLAYQLSNDFGRKVYVIGECGRYIRKLFQLRKDLRERVSIILKLRSYLTPPLSTVVCRTKGELKLLRSFRKDLKLIHAPLGGGSYKISGNRLPKKYQYIGPSFTTYYYSEAFLEVAVEQDEIISYQGRIVEEPVKIMQEILGDEVGEYWAQLSAIKHPPIFICPTNSADYVDPSELQIQINEFAKKFESGTCVISFHPMEKNLIIPDGFEVSIDTTISLLYCDIFVTDVTSALYSAIKNDIEYKLLKFTACDHRANHPMFCQIFGKKEGSW